MQQGHQQHWNTLLRTYVTFIAAICVSLAIISASCPLAIMTRLGSAFCLAGNRGRDEVKGSASVLAHVSKA